MKFVPALLICLAACGYHPSRPSPAQTADSVYKVHESITVDTSSYCAGDAECLKNLINPYTFRFMGSAWVAETARGKSYLMTAGHLCETGETYPYTTISLHWGEDGISLESKTYHFPIISTGYGLEDRDGITTKGATAVLDDDQLDLCLLGVSGDMGDPLPIADSDPSYGDRCFDVGAPDGIWGGGIAPIVDVTFSGRGTLLDNKNSLVFSGRLDHGSSGSPVVCSDGVEGVVTLGAFPYGNLFSAVSHEVVDGFIARALHRE